MRGVRSGLLRRIGRRAGMIIMSLRGTVKKCLPPALHHLAGRSGRALIRYLDRFSMGNQAPDWRALPTDARAAPRERIVYVSDGLQLGGAERQLCNLLVALQKAGSRPLLICFHLRDGQDFFVGHLSGVDVEFRDALGYSTAKEVLARIFGNADLVRVERSLAWAPEDVKRDIVRLVAEFARVNPAVVHGWQDYAGLVAGFAAAVTGVPSISLSTRNLNPANFEYYRPWMRPAYLRLAGESCVTFTNNSQAGAADYETWLRLARGRFRVVRNGVLEEGIEPISAAVKAERRRSLGIATDVALVGGLFRWQSEKRPLLWLDTAHRVAARRPECQFILAGGGPLESQMRALVKRLALSERVVFVERTTTPLDILSTFDVVLLTSILEGTPNVVLEAGLLGIPIVATDVGGTREAMLPGTNGFIVGIDPFDDDGILAARLAEAVLAALDDRTLAAEARERGPPFVRREFGCSRLLADTLGLYGRRLFR